ncbi:MAG TPA: FHA domain-containing protein [Polyangiaceae bacterium]
MPVTVAVRSGGSGRGERARENLAVTFDAPVIVIGRGEGSEVRLPDPSVSHRHATIRQRGSEYILVDEGSTNGTFMGGVKLGAQAPRILKHGDLARVGRVWLEIRFDGQLPAPQTVLATKELALALVARALDAQGELGGPRIVAIAGPDRDKSLALDQPGRAYVMGRGQDVDLVLEDADASRRHVQVVRRADQVVVRDLGSKNGAHLDSEKLDGRDRSWKPGQELRIANGTFAYQHAAIEALGELERAADEKIRADEPIAPPEPLPPVGSHADAAGSSRAPSSNVHPGERAVRERGAAPIAAVPRPNRGLDPPSNAPARRKAGWNSTDFIVVLLALGVLALSIVGLFWLFRG